MRNRRYINIRGERWKFILGKPPANLCDGLCDYNTRTIYVRQACNKQERRAAAIHEVLHASLRDIEESVIAQVEAALCSALDLIE